MTSTQTFRVATADGEQVTPEIAPTPTATPVTRGDDSDDGADHHDADRLTLRPVSPASRRAGETLPPV